MRRKIEEADFFDEPPREKLVLINLKVSVKDRDAILDAARKFTNGNVSQWLRFAGTRFRPSKGHRPLLSKYSK